MALTVAQLAGRIDLDTWFVAGESGADAVIEWAHVCELSDPWHWIGEGDLLMTTGLGVPQAAEAQVEYVERLAEVGVVGVAVGERMNAPPLHPRMLKAADRRGLPVLMTRRDIPFVALARAVAAANAEAHLARIDQTERVYEVLRRSSAEDLDLARLLDSLGDIVTCPLLLLDPTNGRSLVPGMSIPNELASALSTWRPGVLSELPATVELPGVNAVGIVTMTPRPALLIASAPSGALPDTTVLRHVAAATALHQTRLYADRERSLRLASSLLAQLLDQRISPAAARAPLAAAGLGGATLVLGAFVWPDGRDDVHLVHHHLCDSATDHLMLSRPPVTYVLLREDPLDVQGLVDAVLPGVTLGISDAITSLSDLVTAQRQAQWALRRAQERRITLLRHSDDLGESLFLPVDPADSRAIARRVLGTALDHDRDHAAHLVDSLRVFLEENRSWLRASERLTIHKQTLVYRMRRVEELTDRNLSDTGDVAELWLALRAATSSGLVDR